MQAEGAGVCQWLVLFAIFAVLAVLVTVFCVVIVMISEAGRHRRRSRKRGNTIEEAQTSKSASAKRRKRKSAKYRDEGTQSDITLEASTNLQTPTQESHNYAYFELPPTAHDPQAIPKDSIAGPIGGRGGLRHGQGAFRS